jgi:putative zinc finger protein
MRSECREIRVSLGAHALGRLSGGERATVEGHLAGCAECRAELESLGAVARLLSLADPARITTPPPRPLGRLGERITETIGAEMAAREERQAARSRSRRRRRLGFAFGGVAAVAAAAVLAIAILVAGGGQGAPEQQIDFTDVPQGVEIDAALQPHGFGTEIQMYVSGVRSGTLCRVFLEGEDGRRYQAGSFRYRWGDETHATLGSALDISRTKAIGVHAGSRTFMAPVRGGGATAPVRQPNEEEST